MWILIQLSILGCCFLQLCSSACTTGQCLNGVAARDPGSGGISTRYADTPAEAESARSLLIASSFVSLNASDACVTENVCGTGGVCTVNGTYQYICNCNASYTASRGISLFSCINVDECANSSLNTCSQYANCTDLDPGYSCACNLGYTGDGLNCTDISECSLNPCGANTNCSEPVLNNYTCTCLTGYEGDPYANCTEIDECARGSDNCHDNATCQNTNGSFTCTCILGFTGNGTYCEDINECATFNCTGNATCSEPSLNNYTCTCDPGYAGDGYTSCTDINECASNPCGGNATCTEPVADNYTCTCDTYFTGDPYNSNCTDLDECATNTSDCSPDANCTNADPGFTCVCKTGFSGNGTYCADIDECINATCHANASCANTHGSFACNCPSGYTGDGVTACTPNPGAIDINFFITCTSLNFSSDLQDSSSTPYFNVTSALRTAIDTFVSNVDPSSSLDNVSYSFANSTDGLGSAEAEISVTINNTILSAADFERRVNEIVESVQCGAVASTDECLYNTDNCGSGRTCSDTPYGFCCYQDIDYTSSLAVNWTYNASVHGDINSTESQNICNEVQNLARHYLDLKETRGCRQSITFDCEKLLSGSVEAVLHLSIVNATYTVADIATELQKAVGQSTPWGTVIRAGDFDDCSSQYELERNCSAFATCLNFAGNFSCECNATHYDNGTTPGKICISPVTVSCNSSNISVSILSDYYTRLGVNLSVLHLADDSCSYSTHAVPVGDSIEFTASINDCNTTLTTSPDNSTIIVSNYITNLPSSGVFTGIEYLVPFQCEFPATLNISRLFKGVVNQVSVPSVAATGGFSLVFNMFTNNSFTNAYGPAQTFGSNEIIYGQISITDDISDVSVKMERCWGTPTPDANDPDAFEYLTNGCSNGNAVQFTLISNGDGSARFSFQMFFFTQVDSVYLHCDVQVCTPACISSCPSKRRRREAVERTEEVTITIQIKLDPNDPRLNNGIVPNYGINGTNGPTSTSGSNVHDITLPIVSAILAFVLIVLLALLVIVAVRKSRASKANYDMTHVNMHTIGVKPPEY